MKWPTIALGFAVYIGLPVTIASIAQHIEDTRYGQTVEYMGVKTRMIIDTKNERIKIPNGWVDACGDQFHCWKQVWNWHHLQIVNGELRAIRIAGAVRMPPVTAYSQPTDEDVRLWNTVFGSGV